MELPLPLTRGYGKGNHQKTKFLHPFYALLVCKGTIFPSHTYHNRLKKRKKECLDEYL
jgi:hypothetical protein